MEVIMSAFTFYFLSRVAELKEWATLVFSVATALYLFRYLYAIDDASPTFFEIFPKKYVVLWIVLGAISFLLPASEETLTLIKLLN
jgi:hypothetical protein